MAFFLRLLGLSRRESSGTFTATIRGSIHADLRGEVSAIAQGPLEGREFLIDFTLAAGDSAPPSIRGGHLVLSTESRPREGRYGVSDEAEPPPGSFDAFIYSAANNQITWSPMGGWVTIDRAGRGPLGERLEGRLQLEMLGRDPYGVPIESEQITITGTFKLR